MSDDSRALDILQAQVESLKEQLKAANAERDEYRDAVVEVSDERDTLKGSVGAETETLSRSQARIAELEGTLRDRAHLDKFTELAKGAKAKEGAIKHLWQLSGYKAEDDEVDEKALGKVIERLRKEADYAFEPAKSEEETVRDAAKDRVSSRTKYGLEIRGEAPEPAGGGRGTRNAGGDGTIVTQEMRADPKFMLDPRNRELITAAAKEGRFR